MNKRKYIIYLISLAITTSSLAVSINPKGVGEVLIYPYYTVNNNFNTFYSVVNTSDQAKAIKIRFLEGENSAVVLSFNVYLAAHDVWVGNLSSFTSSISGHAGEPSVLHTTDDNSCSPYLNKSGQEFLPFMIDTNITFNNNSLQRATDGHIEVIEMGTLNGASEQATNHDSDDIPNNCYQLELAWDNVGYWSQDPTTDLDATTGGLSGTATLLNITEGISVGYDALALDGFWQGTNIQTSPGSLLPNIGNAYPQSQVLAGGAVLTTNWQTGVQAVTAVMMQQSIFNQFSTEEILNAKTEWVVSFPTKYLHVNNQFSAEPPFSQIWNGVESCESLSITMWDREEINHPTSMFSSCYSVNVIEFLQTGDEPGTTSELLGSDNLTTAVTHNNSNATKDGWAKINLAAGNQGLISSSNVHFTGLPAVGFMVERSTNAGGPLGVLSQYAGLHNHKLTPLIQADLIFYNRFESL